MPKLSGVNTTIALGVLGWIGGYLVYADPKNAIITMIVGGLLGALNLSPQKKDPTE